MGDGFQVRSSRGVFVGAMEELLLAARSGGATDGQVSAWLAEGISRGFVASEPTVPVSQEEFLEHPIERRKLNLTLEDADPAALNLGQTADQESPLLTLTLLQQVRLDAERLFDRTAKHSDALSDLFLRGTKQDQRIESLEGDRDRGIYALTVNGKMAQEIGEQKKWGAAVNEAIDGLLTRLDALESQRFTDNESDKTVFESIGRKLNDLTSRFEGRLSTIEKHQQTDCNHMDELRQVCGRRFVQIDELLKSSEIRSEKAHNLRESLTTEVQARQRSDAGMRARLKFLEESFSAQTSDNPVPLAESDLGQWPEDDGPT